MDSNSMTYTQRLLAKVRYLKHKFPGEITLNELVALGYLTHQEAEDVAELFITDKPPTTTH